MKVHTTFTAELDIAEYLERRKKQETNFVKSRYLNDLIRKDMEKIKNMSDKE